MEETELLHPNSEQITFHPLKNPWRWIVTSSENVCFSSLVRLSDNMGSIDFSIIYQSYFEADCIIIGLRHFKSYIFWTTSTCHFQTKKSRADFYLFYKTRITDTHKKVYLFTCNTFIFTNQMNLIFCNKSYAMGGGIKRIFA